METEPPLFAPPTRERCDEIGSAADEAVRCDAPAPLMPPSRRRPVRRSFVNALRGALSSGHSCPRLGYTRRNRRTHLDERRAARRSDRTRSSCSTRPLASPNDSGTNAVRNSGGVAVGDASSSPPDDAFSHRGEARVSSSIPAFPALPSAPQLKRRHSRRRRLHARVLASPPGRPLLRSPAEHRSQRPPKPPSATHAQRRRPLRRAPSACVRLRRPPRASVCRRPRRSSRGKPRPCTRQDAEEHPRVPRP